MGITIFVTGGTFDKEYNPISQKLSFKKTHLPEILKNASLAVRIKVRKLMMIDSLQMTSTNRKEIVLHCQKSKDQHIIITHGTDTMVRTARELAQNITDKTIVLTGAMIPYTMKNSDSEFNLGTALAFVQTLPPGVYIAMDGTYFPYNKVRKNTTSGRFVRE